MSTHPGFLYSSDNSSHQLVDAVLGESESNALPTYGLLKFTISTFIAAALWHLIRLRYPCITTAGLNSKEKKVDELYEDAIEKDSFTGPTLEDITRRRIERVLKAKASQIRTRSLAMASSIWLQISLSGIFSPTLNPISNIVTVWSFKGALGVRIVLRMRLLARPSYHRPQATLVPNADIQRSRE
ncbi:hypothetical protein Moror_12287, partial [Moniliophthora roreri MCA 2997]